MKKNMISVVINILKDIKIIYRHFLQRREKLIIQAVVQRKIKKYLFLQKMPLSN